MSVSINVQQIQPYTVVFVKNPPTLNKMEEVIAVKKERRSL
jgi:hypothetical protein